MQALKAIPLFFMGHGRLPGLALAFSLAAAAFMLAQGAFFQRAGLSALTLAIALGMAIGNTRFFTATPSFAPGVDFTRSWLLRTGIVLYGFRISFHEIGAVGWSGVVIAVAIVALTFCLAMRAGKFFGLDRQTSALIGAGSAICGAAAVMAAQTVIKGQEHKVSIAVATVVVFGTMSMVLYPLLYPYLGLSQTTFGLYAGSTIHEVAQVVAVGEAIGDLSAKAAVVEKMLRVMMLAPFLLLLSMRQPDGAATPTGPLWKRLCIPWFAILFLLVSALNSLLTLPAGVVDALVTIDTVILCAAMAAVGLRTNFRSLRTAGTQPLKLAGLLFVFLTVGGYAVNWIVLRIADML